MKALRFEMLFSSSAQNLGREFVLVGVGQALAALGGIVGVRLLTSLLSPTAYGELALGLTAVTLAQQTALGPVSGAALRFFAAAREKNQLAAYWTGVRRLLRHGIISLSVVAAFMGLFLVVLGGRDWLGLACGGFSFALLSGCGSTLDAIQNAARQRRVVAWHDGLGSWLRFLIAAGLVRVFNTTAAVAMSGFALASAAVFCSQIWFFRSRILILGLADPVGGKFDVKGWTEQMSSYAWPFAVWGLFAWMQSVSDRWALQLFDVTSSVGFYAVLYQLGFYPMTFLSVVMTQLLSPVLFGRAGDASSEDRLAFAHRPTVRMVQIMLLAGLVGFSLAFWFHHSIFSLLVGPEYQRISGLLPWAVLSGALFSAGQLAALSLLSGTRTQDLIAPKMLTALVGIGLSGIGAYALGIKGVVLANLAFSALYFIWVILLSFPSRTGNRGGLFLE